MKVRTSWFVDKESGHAAKWTPKQKQIRRRHLNAVAGISMRIMKEHTAAGLDDGAAWSAMLETVLGYAAEVNIRLANPDISRPALSRLFKRCYSSLIEVMNREHPAENN